jgi:NADH-quinone oxidoreductase subunit J
MIETVLLWFFAAAALAMLVARHPMRVALALISTMLALAAIYGLVGVHVIAVFQVLIYVGAVMVFMVYVIMLLNVRDPSFVQRYSRMLVPGLAGLGLLVAALGYGIYGGVSALAGPAGEPRFGVQPFSIAFLEEYWLHFELISLLLVAAVVAAVAVIKITVRGRG